MGVQGQPAQQPRLGLGQPHRLAVAGELAAVRIEAAAAERERAAAGPAGRRRGAGSPRCAASAPPARRAWPGSRRRPAPGPDAIPGAPRAVSISTGVAPAGPCCSRSQRVREKPSSPGIITSNTSQVEIQRPDQLARRRAAGRRGDPEAGAGQIFLEQFADAVVVVDDQQMAGASGRLSWAGSALWKGASPFCLTQAALRRVLEEPCERRSPSHVSRSLRRPRWMDLAGRPVRALARGDGARTDAWPALRLGGVRGRAHVWGRDLRADGAHRASVQVGGNPRLRDPLHGGADRPGLQGHLRQERPDRRLCAADRLARLGDDRGLGPEHQHPRRHRLLGLAELFQPGGEGQGHPPVLGQVQAPLAGDRADRTPRPPAST